MRRASEAMIHVHGASKQEHLPEWPAEEERYAYVKHTLARVVPPPADLIELGAAPGTQSLALAHSGYRVTAVDLGEASDAWADEREGTMESAFARSNVQFVRWNLEETPYPFRDGSFDVALLTEVLEHLRDYPLKGLSEIHRILRPGGVLLLTTPNAASPMNRIRLALGRTVYTSLSDWMFGLPHARHAREYTVVELRQLVTHAGFEVLFLEGRHFHIRSGREGRLAVAAKQVIDALGRRRPSLGANLLILARSRS
jgi:SAM-dependent methyltransferase